MPSTLFIGILGGGLLVLALRGPLLLSTRTSGFNFRFRPICIGVKRAPNELIKEQDPQAQHVGVHQHFQPIFAISKNALLH